MAATAGAFSLLPLYRGEVGRGVTKLRSLIGEPPDCLRDTAAPPAEGCSMAETAALQPPGAPACRCGTPFPTSPLPGGERRRRIPAPSRTASLSLDESRG